MPGPGTYDSKKMKLGDPSTLGSKAGASTDDSSTLSQNPNPFMSKTARCDMWTNSLEAPYTKQTFKQNPASNFYFDNKRNNHAFIEQFIFHFLGPKTIRDVVMLYT